MLLPEPIRRAELNVRRIDLRDLVKQRTQSPSSLALLNAERDVSDPILDPADIAGGQGQETMRISLRCVKKVAVAALQGVTVGQRAEGRDDAADGRIDGVQSESRRGLLTIASEAGVVYEPLGLRKGFHLNDTEMAA